MRIERFEDIEAWKLAWQLTCKVYDLTKKSRFTQDFGIKGQIKDAASSFKGFNRFRVQPCLKSGQFDKKTDSSVVESDTRGS